MANTVPRYVVFETYDHKFKIKFQIQDGQQEGGPYTSLEDAIKDYYAFEKVMNGNLLSDLKDRAVLWLDGTYDLLSYFEIKTASSPMQYRIRRKSDGKFFGNSKWGETHSSNGKFYTTFNKAVAAFKASYGLNPNDHEVVEYQLKETKTYSIEKQ